jgi:hypothetical protein
LSLRRALQEGGVTFAKLGQLLSIRHDQLPAEFTSELAQLQDRAEPERWERMAARLEDRARWARAIGTSSLARGFAAAVREELDFRVEARNMAAIAATWPSQQLAIGDGVPVVLPAVHEQLCTEHVLVTDWLDGVNLGAAGQLIDDLGLERTELARALLRCLLYQITESGVFHADLHPGNIVLLTNGRLALLDLGSVGRLDAQLRSALQNLFLAIGRGDPAALSDALLELVTALTTSTNSSWNGPWASSLHSTSPAPHRPLGCLPTCSAWSPASSSPSRPRWRPSSARSPRWKARSPSSRPGSTSPSKHASTPPPAQPGNCRQQPCRKPPPTSCSRCSPCCAGCRAGLTASPPPWNKAGSASTYGRSPTSATAGWSPTSPTSSS